MSERDDALNPATSIAVVGMACRFPGARSPEEFWQNLRNGVESVEDLPDEDLLQAGEDPALLANPAYVKRAAALSGMTHWDHGFFGFSPKEAAIMDPQHRHFLELSWEALETAGYAPGTFDGPVGVFAGCGANTYMMFNLLSDPDLLREQGFFLLRHIGNDKDFLATRVSYHLDLTGPGINVQTACSTSLAAIHLATQSLLSFECDLALAGGVTITHPHRRGYLYQEGEILSPDGRCRAFDADSGGTVLGDGAGAVVLRRLEDAQADGDTVLAVIRGTAVNNDGSRKVGYLAPSVEGQSRVIAEALAVADVEPDSIGYVEAHGTGTRIGDPIEVAALTRAFRTGTDRTGFCGLGSVKTNIGHLDTAAGVAGFMKAVLALQHGEIPPSLHFRAPNPELDLETSPFFVVSERTPWPRGENPRRAGVSSLGVGGTNVHLILEEAPADRATGPARREQLVLLSGRSRGVVGRAGARLVDHLETHPDRPLADAAWTLQTGRSHFPERRFLVADSPEAVVDALVTENPDVVHDHTADGVVRSVAFLFAGGGAQYPGMAGGLYRTEEVFRSEIDRGLELLDPEARSAVRRLLFPGEAGEPLSAEERERPSLALPALFLVQLAQARLWRSWGIEPSAMIGHSMGEYTAACLAGVFSMEEALELVVLRGRLFEQVSGGSMLSVPLSESALVPLLGDDLSLAAVNGPELCVASGPREAIDHLQTRLESEGVEVRRVRIDVAAHSSMLEPILDPFRTRLRQARMSSPTLPFASNLTGKWITPEDATDPEYWVRQLRETVRFSDGLRELLTDPDRILLEVGPGRTLATLARIHPDRNPAQETFTSLRHPDEEIEDERFLLTVLGRLWQRGVPIDWRGFHAAGARRRVPLPTYPFESEPHFVAPGPLPSTHAMVLAERGTAAGAGRVEPGTVQGADTPAAGDVVGRSGPISRDPRDWLHEVHWRAGTLPGPGDSGRDRPEQGGDELPESTGTLVFGTPERAGQLAALLAEARPGEPVLEVHPGDAFTKEATGFRLRPGSREDMKRLLDALEAEGGIPTRIVHADTLGLPPLDPSNGGPDPLREIEARAFLGLLVLGQALGERMEDGPTEILVVTEGAHRLEGDEGGHPAASLVTGPVRVLPAEFPGLEVRWLDLPLEDRGGAGGPGGDLRDALLQEFSSGGDEPLVAIRASGRFVPEYRPWSETSPPTDAGRSGFGDAAGPLPRGAVCVITGGFGGLGLEIARHLAEHFGARIALLGRTSLPPREGWEGAEARGADPRILRAIGVIRELERKGAQVLPLAVDVTDEQGLEGARRRIVEAFGEVDAVFHAAGVLEDGLALHKTEGSARRVLAPKVRGTVALGRVFRNPSPSRFLLFSSVSAEAGLPGQIDYTSANAFLDAYARMGAGHGEGRTISVGWSAWRETGMAVDQAAGLVHWPPLVGPASGSSEAGGGSGWAPAGDPRFDAVDPGAGRVRTRLREGRLWLLDEHRTREGTPLVPGAGFLELLRAAAEELGRDGVPSFEDLFFLAPFLVPEGETREMELRIPTEGEGAFVVLGRGRPDEPWVEHVKGRIAFRPGDADRAGGGDGVDLAALRTRMKPLGAGEWASRQDLDLGPRWDNVRAMSANGTEVLVSLALPEERVGDLALHRLHPALLDNATAVAGPLLPGFGEKGFVFVPASYGSFEMHRPLPARLVSHIRVAESADGDSPDLSVLDVTLLDEAGQVLAEARQFILVRVEAGEIEKAQAEAREARAARARAVESAVAAGIPTEVGLGIVDLVLGTGGLPPHLLVSPEPMEVRLAALRAAAGASGARVSGSGRGGRPVPQVDVGPVEAALAALEAVTEAAVTAHEDRPGEIRLVAHVVLDPTRFATVSELRRNLRATLPPERVPQNFVQLDRLPRSASGEIRRGALHDPFAPVDDYVEPSTPTQGVIAGIWADLLGAERIGIHDNFLDVGGHSLLAMRAILRIEKETGVRLGPVEMNLYTLEQIAAHVDASAGGAGPSGKGTERGGEMAGDADSSTGIEGEDVRMDPASDESGPEVAVSGQGGREPEGARGTDGDPAGTGKADRGGEGFLSGLRRLIPGG